MLHLLRLIQAETEVCDADCKKKAKKIRQFFTDKKVLAFLVWNLDVQEVYTKESLVSQKSDSSVIGK